jgi:hypothetical protein
LDTRLLAFAPPRVISYWGSIATRLRPIFSFRLRRRCRDLFCDSGVVPGASWCFTWCVLILPPSPCFTPLLPYKVVCNPQLDPSTTVFPTRDVAVALRRGRQGALEAFPGRGRHAHEVVQTQRRASYIPCSHTHFPSTTCLYCILWFEASQLGQSDSPSFPLQAVCHSLLRFCCTTLLPLNHKPNTSYSPYISQQHSITFAASSV